MAEVVVVGSGVVGTATGKGFLRHGHAVRFVDIDSHRIDHLRRQGLSAGDQVVLAGGPKLIFLTLPTPNIGTTYDLDAFAAGTASVGDAIKLADDRHTVVVRSTVPPGTASDLVTPILEAQSGSGEGDQFVVASNPEFLRAACALDDFLNPWMTVIGSPNKRTVERLTELYQPFGGELRAFDNTATPEMIKCAHNIYNATKISFWNEMGLVADHIGVDIRDVAETVARSAEGSININYGIKAGKPYGGACLPKDTKGFLGFARRNGLDLDLLSATVGVNDRIASRQRPIELHLDDHHVGSANGRHAAAVD